MSAARLAGEPSPMSYVHEGRQYIVVAIGGGGHDAEWVALALR